MSGNQKPISSPVFQWQFKLMTLINTELNNCGGCRINENDLFKHDWRSRSSAQVLQYIFLKWSLAFLVGLLTGLIATLINLAVENIAGYKLLAVSGLVEKKRSWILPCYSYYTLLLRLSYIKVFFFFFVFCSIVIEEILKPILDRGLEMKVCCDGCRYLTGFIYLTTANFVLTLFAAFLCVCFAPTAAGPGIPEIKAYLNGVDTPNMFGASTLIVKVSWLSNTIWVCQFFSLEPS